MTPGNQSHFNRLHIHRALQGGYSVTGHRDTVWMLPGISTDLNMVDATGNIHRLKHGGTHDKRETWPPGNMATGYRVR